MQQESNNTVPNAMEPALRRSIIPTALQVPDVNSEITADLPPQHANVTKNNTKSGFSYEIKGETSQLLEMTLMPGQSVTGEVTALMYYENGINMKMRMSGAIEASNGGFFGKLLGIGKAAISGQKLFMMNFTNSTQRELKLAFSMPYAGTIVAIDLGAVGGEIFCQNDSFLCAASDLRISSVTPRDLGANFLNSVQSIQKIQGSGFLFLFCGGSLMERKLIPGDSLNVTSGAALAMQPSIVFKNKTIRNVGITGQGHMLTEITGSGRVWLQSLPNARARDITIAHTGMYFGIKQKKKNPVWGI